MSKRAHNFKDVTGQRFGKLVVLELDRVEGKISYWRCRCDCGGFKVCRRANLGRSCNSCGCIKLARILDINEARIGTGTVEALYNKYRKDYVQGAKQKGRSFNLTYDEFVALTKKPCEYCGSPPSHKKTDPFTKVSILVNGIDRVDNEQGYLVANSVSCCRTCNLAKRQLSVHEFLQWAERIHQHQFRKKECQKH